MYIYYIYMYIYNIYIHIIYIYREARDRDEAAPPIALDHKSTS